MIICTAIDLGDGVLTTEGWWEAWQPSPPPR